MKKNITICVFAIAVLVGAVAVLHNKMGQRDAGLKRITVAQYGDVFLYMPLYVAQDCGFFETNGLHVSIVSTGGDDKTFAAVASGSAMFGIGMLLIIFLFLYLTNYVQSKKSVYYACRWYFSTKLILKIGEIIQV